MQVTSSAEKVLSDLLEGNRRFYEGRSTPRTYTPADIERLSKNQEPIAAVIACSDSRSTPSIIFDQPLGSLFTSRIPGNVVSEGVKWMSELAVGDFKVPLVLVLGHTGCLAVQSVLENKIGAPGGMLRHNIFPATQKAVSSDPAERMLQAVTENAKNTVAQLQRESALVRSAVADGLTSVIAAVYDMETGIVRRVE